jgi:hypothetical protein
VARNLLLNGSTLTAPSVSAGEKFVLDLAQGRMTLEEIADRSASWCR